LGGVWVSCGGGGIEKEPKKIKKTRSQGGQGAKNDKEPRSEEGEGAKMDDESGSTRSQERNVYAQTRIEKGN
jgi:hypothetical protein